MIKNYLKTKSLTWVMLGSLLTGHVFAQTHTWENFREEEEESNRIRKEYYEKRTKSEFFKINEEIRHAEYEKYKKAKLKSGTSRTASVETIADGMLNGEWIEKGSKNRAGRIWYSDLWAPTNNVYAISDGGNVWKGNYNGTGWACLNNSFKLSQPKFLDVVPNGTGKRIIVGTTSKVYYSDNDGSTWEYATGLNDISNGEILKTITVGQSGTAVFVLAREGSYVSLYRSINKGTSFTRIRKAAYSGSDDRKYSIWAPLTENTYAYMINKDSTFIMTATTNTGTVIRMYKHNLNLGGSVRLSGTKSGSNIIFYMNSDNGFYRSENNGSSWQPVNSPGVGLFSDYSLSVSTSNPNLLFWGSLECYRGIYNTSTGQISWTMMNYWMDYDTDPATKLHADIPSVVPVFTSSNVENFLVNTDGGIYKSTDGLTTVHNITLIGMQNSQYYGVYTLRTDPNHIMAGSQDQGFSKTFVDNGGVLDFAHIWAGDDGRSVSTNHVGYWHSSIYTISYFPDGKSNTYFDLWSQHIPSTWLPSITEHPTNPEKLYYGSGISDTDPTANILEFSFTGTGVTYNELPYDFAAQSGCNNISGIGISRQNNNYWYVMTDNGRLFTSSNGGSSFTKHNSFPVLDDAWLLGHAIYPSKTTFGTVYIGGQGTNTVSGVYKLTNHGQSFAPLGTGLPPTLVFDICANDNESLIFAATEVGPYVYVAATNTWYPMKGFNGPDQSYQDAEFISSTNTVRFATYGRGIWDFKIQSTGNQAPIVTITSPASNSTFTTGANIVLSANATDDVSVQQVDFYNGTTFLGTDYTPPYTFTWNNVPAGNHTINANAYDNLGLVGVASPVAITVSSAPVCTAPQWVSTTAYINPAEVEYAGIRYRANYWTQNQRPDLNNGTPYSGKPWTSLGTCNTRVAAQTMNISPNPAEGSTVVAVDITEETEVVIYVIDYLGRKVADVYKGKLGVGKHTYDMEAANFTPGIYRLIMEGQNGNMAVGFLKK